MAELNFNENTLYVAGDLDFNSIAMIWKQSLPMLATHKDISINLEKITHSNSGALTLLIEWLKYAKQNQFKIHFKNIPSQLLAIAEIIGIDKILLTN